MKIYIPTLSRPREQKTLMNLTPSLRAQTTLVVQDRQYKDYAHWFAKGRCERIMRLDPKIRRIAPTRQAILEDALYAGHDKIVMIDDDVDFYVRKNPKDWHLTTPNPTSLNALFRMIDRMLHSELPVMGVSGREGNNRHKGDWADNGRIMRFTAFYIPIVATHARYRRTVNGIEDFDVLLQLLRAGYPNKVSYRYAQGHRSAQEPGGCSDWRTNETHNKTIEWLKKFHPGFVQVRTKVNKTGGKFGKRMEATIFWKDAYRVGKRKRIKMELRMGTRR